MKKRLIIIAVLCAFACAPGAWGGEKPETLEDVQKSIEGTVKKLQKPL